MTAPYTTNPQVLQGHQYVEGTDTPTTLNALLLHGCTSFNFDISTDPPGFQYGDGDGNDMTHVYWTVDAGYQPWALLNDTDWVFYAYPIIFGGTPFDGGAVASFFGVMDDTNWSAFYTAV